MMSAVRIDMPYDLENENSDAPAYAYDLIMISIHAADSKKTKLNKFKKSAVQHGADKKMVEMAIYRGEQLSVLDEL